MEAPKPKPKPKPKPHPEEGKPSDSNKCPSCGHVCRSPKALKNHVTRICRSVRHCCPHCDRSFIGPDGLERHIRDQHPASCLACPHCERSFVHANDLEKHVRDQHPTSPLPCPHCECSFKAASALASHLRHHHPTLAVAACTHCPRLFKTTAALANHVRDQHTISSLTCPHCEYIFESADKLAAHIYYRHQAGLDEAVCLYCIRSFKTAKALAGHVREKHPTSPQIRQPCPHCHEHSFKTHNGLAKHVRHSHPGREQPRRPKANPCLHCSKAFNTDIQLARHIHVRHPPPAPPAESPLDAFFRAYQEQDGFTYDRTMHPSSSFNRLRKSQGWEGVEHWDGRAKFGSALRLELGVWFGGEEIHAMQRFLRAIGADRKHFSMKAFKNSFGERCVNLIDLVHWARHEGSRGVEVQRVKMFDNPDALKAYSSLKGKGFPREHVQDQGDLNDGNPVLWHLMGGFPRGGRGSAEKFAFSSVSRSEIAPANT